MNLKKIKQTVFERNLCTRIVFLVIGIFLLALNYNLFLAPNQFVIGGLTGLSLVVNYFFGWNAQVFIYVATALLLVVSFFLLGLKSTMASVVGGVLYPIMITFTTPLATTLLEYIQIDNIVLLILIISLLQGVGSGLVLKFGFNTGGTDVIMKIINKYFHVSEGKSSLFTHISIILLGGIAFGLNNMVYAILILILYTSLVDKLIIGISDSKLFFIYTKKWEEVRDYVLNDLDTGVTILEAEGGYSKSKNTVLMCVVPNKDYYLFKEIVLEIDPRAFFVINDCYEVHGGMKRRNLPFI